MNVINDFHRQEYRFLSNFYPSIIPTVIGDMLTVEHAYQAFKANDSEGSLWVAAARTPGEAKRRGRQIKVRPNWDMIKYDIMHDFVRIKFTYNNELGFRLLETGDSLLVEGNRWGDTYWGLCNGVGENNLGKILMDVREKLKNTC